MVRFFGRFFRERVEKGPRLFDRSQPAVGGHFAESLQAQPDAAIEWGVGYFRKGLLNGAVIEIAGEQSLSGLGIDAEVDGIGFHLY